jgi:hypothetical protein
MEKDKPNDQEESKDNQIGGRGNLQSSPLYKVFFSEKDGAITPH